MATITSHNEEEKQKQKKKNEEKAPGHRLSAGTRHQLGTAHQLPAKKARPLSLALFLESTRSARQVNQLALVLAQNQGGIGTTKAKAIGHDRGQLSLTGRGYDINPVTV